MLLSTMLGALLLAAGFTQDGTRVTARVSSATPSVGEQIVFEIAIDRAEDNVEIGTPAFPRGLLLQGTQDFTEMQFSIPGGRRQTRRREFMLQATSPGRFRIPPVVVRVGNTSYRTNAVEVAVTGNAPQPRTFASSSEAWLRATMSPETVYVGQQSTLTIEAGFADEVRMRLTRPPVFDPPSPTGFWVQDVPGGVRSRLRPSEEGVVEILSLQRAYFPLSPGRFAFAPARAVIDIREGFLFAPETREIRSASPKLTVLPLPERDRPSDFRGAVGSYTVRALIQPDTVAVGEAAQLTIEIVGKGNVKAAPPPVLPTIRSVEQFAPTENASLSFDGAIVTGTKQFQWVIIPERAGAIEIPAVSYSFFDPESRAYRTVRTDPVTLHAQAAAAHADEDGVGGTTLGALRTTSQPASLSWVRSRGFLLAQLIPIMALLAVLGLRRTRRAPPRATELIAELHAIAAAQPPYAQFLRDVEGIVRSAAAERAGMSTLRTAGVDAVAAALRASGVAEAVVARVVVLIRRLETERFAPSSAQDAERQSIVQEAEALIGLLEPRRAAAAAAPALFAALLVMQAPASAPFDQGVDLYRSGQFAAAAQAFESAIASDSSDVSAWANLGNAYYRAGERGRAIWAWSRAARAAPRDDAITRNLQAAGAVEVLRTRPPLSVRPVEWYLLAALGWWIALGVVIVAVARRRASLASWALPGIALVIISLSIGVIADGRAYAVAFHAETRLYGDPTVHSPVVRTVQGGAGLDVLERRGDWLRVRTVTQTEGWVETDAVGRL